RGLDPRPLLEPLAERPEERHLDLARQRWKLTAAHPELPVTDLVLVLEEPARRRAGGPRAIFIVDAAVAGAHEEPGLREPAHGASEMRAVHGEDLEAICLEAPDPAGDLRRVPVPLDPERILVYREARLALGKFRGRAELDPRLSPEAPRGRQDVADHRDADEGGSDDVQRKPETEKKASSRRGRAGGRFRTGSAHAIISLSPRRVAPARGHAGQ